MPPLTRFLSMAALGLAVSSPALADPVQDTCRFLGVMGANDQGGVAEMLQDIATQIPDELRADAVNQLTALLGAPLFNGGSAWRIAAFGEDLEEHLILLRLTEGEVAAARVRYEWTPNGLALVSIEFQRQYTEYTARSFAIPPEPIACDG